MNFLEKHDFAIELKNGLLREKGSGKQVALVKYRTSKEEQQEVHTVIEAKEIVTRMPSSRDTRYVQLMKEF